MGFDVVDRERNVIRSKLNSVAPVDPFSEFDRDGFEVRAVSGFISCESVYEFSRSMIHVPEVVEDQVVQTAPNLSTRYPHVTLRGID